MATPDFTLRTFGKGTRVLVDWIFNKHEGVCVEVLEEGHGKTNKGRIRVKITDGRMLDLPANEAVPKAMIYVPAGSCFYHVRTTYVWKP